MKNYNDGKWIKVGNLGELRKALSMFQDTISCNVEIRFLETIDEACDGRSELSIQFKELEIETW